jgi:hypothetical protein
MPTTVVVADRSFSMCVSSSRPTMDPFESAACTEYSPVGRGSETTFSATGPCAVNCI